MHPDDAAFIKCICSKAVNSLHGSTGTCIKLLPVITAESARSRGSAAQSYAYETLIEA